MENPENPLSGSSGFSFSDRFIDVVGGKEMNRKWKAVILSVVLTLYPFVLGPVYYMEPDDYLLNYIANQSYGSAGSAHLVYIRILLGGILKLCYHVTKQVNFYLLMLLVVFICSFAVIHYCLWKKTGFYPGVLISSLINAVIVPFFLTYTVAAFIAAAAGMFLLCEVEADPMFEYRKKTMTCGIAGILFLLAAWQLRRDAVIPVLAMYVPVFLIHVWKQFRSRHTLRGMVSPKPILILCTMLLAVGAVDATAEHLAYRSEMWQSFLEFDDARTQVVDYPILNYEEYQTSFEEIGMNRATYQLLTGWKFADKERMSVSMMQNFQKGPMREYRKQSWLKEGKFQFTHDQKLVTLIPVLILIWMLLRRKHPSYSAALTVLTYLALVGYLACIRMRLVPRVSVPLAFSAVLLILYECGQTGTSHTVKRTALIDIPALLVICVIGGLFLRDEAQLLNDSRNPENEIYYQDLKAEIAAHPDTMYLVDGPIISYLYYFRTPARDVKTDTGFMHIARAGSWDSFSERYYHMAEQFHLKEPDRLLMAPFENENTALVTQNMDSWDRYALDELGFVPEHETDVFQGKSAPIYVVRYRT